MMLELLEMEEWSCGVCLDLFGEGNKCPRLLSCGHCYCSSCLGELITHGSVCPICKADIKYTRVDEVPVNFVLKSLIHRLKGNNYINLCETRSMESEQLESGENMESVSLESGENKEYAKNYLHSEGFCHKHNNCRQLRCMTCSVWVCGMCAILNHKPCRTLLVSESLNEMKEKEVLLIKDEGKKRTKKLKQIDKILHKIKQIRSLIKADIKQIQNTLKNKIQKLEELEKETENLNLLKRKQISFQIYLKKFKTVICNSNSACDFEETKQKLSNYLGNPEWNEPNAVSRTIISQLNTENIIQWVEESGCIYAVSHGSSGTKWGMVQVKSEKIRVHCFQKEKPSDESIIISFRDLVSAVTGSNDLPTKAFLEIWDKGCYCGDVIIGTHGLNPRALNFLLLCLGLKGVSYKGTKFTRVLEEEGNERFEGGNYSSNNGESFPAIVKGIENDGIYQLPWKKGFVGGRCAVKCIETLSYFFVVLTDVEEAEFLACFGEVVEGLHVLEKDFAMGNDPNGMLNDVLIKDCGLILEKKM